jgi:hypothetical protein
MAERSGHHHGRVGASRAVRRAVVLEAPSLGAQELRDGFVGGGGQEPRALPASVALGVPLGVGVLVNHGRQGNPGEALTFVDARRARRAQRTDSRASASRSSTFAESARRIFTLKFIARHADVAARHCASRVASEAAIALPASS